MCVVCCTRTARLGPKSNLARNINTFPAAARSSTTWKMTASRWMKLVRRTAAFLRGPWYADTAFPCRRQTTTSSTRWRRSMWETVWPCTADHSLSGLVICFVLFSVFFYFWINWKHCFTLRCTVVICTLYTPECILHTIQCTVHYTAFHTIPYKTFL